MSNKYLNHIEKKASLIGGALATHLVQNLGTRVALGSKRVSKYLANSFSEGVHGVVDNSLKAKATRLISGAALPDIAVAHKAVHDIGNKMAPLLNVASKRQKVGLRLLSEGRVDKLERFGLHKDPIVRAAHGIASAKMAIPSIDDLVKHKDKVKAVFEDKAHPLVSNILKGISRGGKPVGQNFKPGALTAKAPLSGAIASGVVDPAGGALNTAKTLMSSEKFGKTRVGNKINGFLHKQFIEKPVQSGMNTSKAGQLVNKAKNKMYEIGVNPVSANLKRTSAALTDALKD